MKAQGRPGSIALMASMGGIAGAGFTVGFSTSKGGVVLMAKGPRRRAGTARHPSQFRRPRRDRHPTPARHTRNRTRRRGISANAPRYAGSASRPRSATRSLGSARICLASYVTGTSLLVNGGLLSVI